MRPTPPDISALAKEFPVPTVKLPNPNGYDLLVQAAESIQSGGEGSPATADKLTPEEDLKRQRAFTVKNARALDLVERALQLPIATPRARGSYRGEAPSYEIKKLAQLMMQRNRVYAADKEWNKAVNGGLDIVQMGTALQNGADARGIHLCMMFQSFGYRDLPQWVTQCDVQTAAAAARRLETLEAKMATFHSLTPEVKWASLVSLQEILASNDWKQFRRGSKKGIVTTMRTPEARKRLRAFSDSEIQRHYLTTMDKAIAQAKLPFNRNVKDIPPAADPLSDYLASIYAGSTEEPRALSRSVRWEMNFAVHRILQTAFALQAFKKTNGQYPEKLDELFGKYLSAVTRDPFAPTQPLIYRRYGKEYRLYSVGPDTIDDGGSPILTINVYEKTLGDLVFGYGLLRDGRPQVL